MRKRIWTKWVILTALLVGLCMPLPAMAQSWFDSFYYDSYEYYEYESYYDYYDSGWMYPLYLVSPSRWGIGGCNLVRVEIDD